MRTERVGFALCGSFCTHEKALTALKRLTEEYVTVIPIVSENAAFTDTRFGTSDALLEQLEELTGHEVLYDIPSVEPLGPKGMIDVLVIAPCTGNTLAKLAHGITDTAAGVPYKLFGGYIADTPGFSSFETMQYAVILKDELKYCFREFEEYEGKCRFADCNHIGEKGCAVAAAAENGDIAKSRYESYLEMFEEAKNIKEWEIGR